VPPARQEEDGSFAWPANSRFILQKPGSQFIIL